MHGATQVGYNAADTEVGTPGDEILSVAEAAHFNRTRPAFPVGLPEVCTNAICVPSSDITGEVRISPPVLYAQ
jgi:hypothetical protein